MEEVRGSIPLSSTAVKNTTFAQVSAHLGYPVAQVRAVRCSNPCDGLGYVLSFGTREKSVGRR